MEFWLRVFASIVDTFALLVVSVPMVLLIVERDPAGIPSSGVTGGVGILVKWVVPFAFTIAFRLHWQSTLVKMLLWASIVDARTGQPPSTQQLLIRHAGYITSSACWGLGLLWVAFDARQRGWHDKMAGTVVVRNRTRRSSATGSIAN